MLVVRTPWMKQKSPKEILVGGDLPERRKKYTKRNDKTSGVLEVSTSELYKGRPERRHSTKGARRTGGGGNNAVGRTADNSAHGEKIVRKGKNNREGDDTVKPK